MVSDQRLKGNYGTAVVMMRLSAECLVRPVAADTDVGIDLYCETIVDGRPFLHFWMQVKTGDQCKVDEAGSVKCRFSRNNLSYWMSQPVPVFAALVPTSWPAGKEPDVHIVDITTQLLFRGISNDANSLELKGDYAWRAGDQEEVRRFLREVVPASTARLQCSRGVVASTPTPESTYLRETPAVPVMRYMDMILHQIRTISAQAILFALACDVRTPKEKEFAKTLARIVQQFGDDPHWENFLSRGIVSHASGDYAEARAMYQKATKCIEGDTTVQTGLLWQGSVRALESLDVYARERKPLPRNWINVLSGREIPLPQHST